MVATTRSGRPHACSGSVYPVDRRTERVFAKALYGSLTVRQRTDAADHRDLFGFARRQRTAVIFSIAAKGLAIKLCRFFSP